MDIEQKSKEVERWSGIDAGRRGCSRAGTAATERGTEALPKHPNRWLCLPYF
jgi:hypothetical protein